MNLLKNFPTLQGLVKASTAQSLKEYRGAMDALIRPKTVYTGPTTKKLWSLKEQQEFFKNNPAFSAKLPVKHLSSDYQDELIINADSWCDVGGHKVPEWNMQNTQGDASICADCYEHFIN